MNLINCTHDCVHQSDGYCTLNELCGACVSPINDCIYYCAGSSKNTSKLTDVFDGDKL